jgi:aminoglycoside phosphotransferase (APT) family kinase protein
MTRKSISLDHTTLQRIWDQHQLGRVETVTQASRGINNPTFLINDQYAIRFDGLDQSGRSRFYGEALAYAQLRERNIPAPQVIAVDVSKAIVPHDYILMTKVAGSTIMDSWPTLDHAKRQQVTEETGRYLAMLHNISFEGYGPLHLPAEERFSRWDGYLADYLQQFGAMAVTADILTARQTEKLSSVLAQHRTLFDTVTSARLVHCDFHFENVLQEHGNVTSILDFEWALCGDPMYDFRFEWQWEQACPGSTQALYRGYLAERDLPNDQRLRIRLYATFGYLVWAVNAQNEGELVWARHKLLDGLATF